jgi:hypothetical protein
MAMGTKSKAALMEDRTRTRKFVRDVLVSAFHQQADEQVIEDVTEKVLRTMPHVAKGEKVSA